mmetsp:Transcript_2211/g.2817  ORF Transcript_2211/g.2817 Transcript_2211/m.2817 type:complete len:218 (+) Transcript_2211:37-690(+)
MMRLHDESKSPLQQPHFINIMIDSIKNCYINLAPPYSSSSLFFSNTDNPTPPDKKKATTPRAYSVGISAPKYSAIIFPPINPSTIPTAGSKYFKSEAALDKIVYKLRNPMMANIFDEKTTRGLLVTPKTAGILSTAKTTSLISKAIMQMNKGVAFFTPSTIVKKLLPSNSSVESIKFLLNLTIAFSFMSSSSSSSSSGINVFAELYTRIPANTKRIA